MELSEVLIYLLAYFVPILFFMYMGTDVLMRNSKKLEHRLLSMITFCYILLFLGEFVRHLLDISYSPLIAGLWFSNVGVLIPGLGFHFLIKFAGMEKKLPRYLYPYAFYLALIVIFINFYSQERIISSHEFVQVGIWKMPIYNLQYYITLTIGILISSLYLIPLMIGKKLAGTREHKAVYSLMIYGVIIVIIWHIGFGYFNYGELLPPYPYLYAGAVWCFILRLTMIRYDFLNFIDKRYEKLFNLNPAAILLIDLKGQIKEANPSAVQLFQPLPLDSVILHSILSDEVKARIQQKLAIKEMDMQFNHAKLQIDVIIDGDYVLVDNEPHMILILRDVTVQKQNQREVQFLAYHDPLTRLPNRRYFYDRLDAAIDEARVSGSELAVILIDLDNFKETNDKYGHKAGDEVLQYTSAIIQEAVAQDGMAARLGGDEFVLFLRCIPSVQYVEDRMAQLQRKFADQELVYEGARLPVRMSMGAGYFPVDGEDGDALMNCADKVMYKVKREQSFRG